MNLRNDEDLIRIGIGIGVGVDVDMDMDVSMWLFGWVCKGG